MVDKVKHTAYPTKEWAGMVWAYMGPKETMPEFQPPPWAPTADTRVSIAKVLLPCNWAQILEGAIDSAHSSSLHSSDMVPARVDGAKATDNLWGERWTKLCVNGMRNGVSAATGMGGNARDSHDAVRRICIALGGESVRVGQKLGYKLGLIGTLPPESLARAMEGRQAI